MWHHRRLLIGGQKSDDARHRRALGFERHREAHECNTRGTEFSDEPRTRGTLSRGCCGLWLVSLPLDAWNLGALRWFNHYVSDHFSSLLLRLVLCYFICCIYSVL